MTNIIIIVIIIIALICFFFIRGAYNYQIDFYVSEREKTFAVLYNFVTNKKINEEIIDFHFNKFRKNIYSNCWESFFEFSLSYKEFLDLFKTYIKEKDENVSIPDNVEKIIDSIIKKISFKESFSFLDETECKILSSIVDIMNNSTGISLSEKTAIYYQLKELAQIIENKQIKVNKYVKRFKWGFVTTIVSLIIGIAGIIIPFLIKSN